MSAAVANATDHAAKITTLEATARALAERQGEVVRAARHHLRYFERSPVTLALEQAQTHLATKHAGDAALPKAAEWFLDNYYLIRRVARQVDEELPRGFIRHLPQLASGDAKGRIRIEVLATELVTASNLDLELGTIRRFIDSYQAVSPLTIAELWALPTLLRAAILGHLLRFLDQLRPRAGEARDQLSLDPGAGVERATRTLRVLDVIDWKTFFEETNRVEAVLRGDPAKIYPRMVFETCDSYRKVVEALAWNTGTSEQQVATQAIALAEQAPADPRRGHVGHYLVGPGQRVLERELGYRARRVERVRRAARRWPTVAYLMPLAIATVVPLLVLGFLLAPEATTWQLVVALVVALVPVSVVAITVVQRTLARLIAPRTLPKLDFSRGIPVEARTLVVVPTLMRRDEDVPGLLRQLELHYLGNPDPELRFALLTDDVDGKTMPENTALLERAEAAIAALNTKHGTNGRGPFHILHRESRWNAAEQRFMGWERKRGKLDELNRLLRGDTQTTFARHLGDPDGLEGIQFVITLDSDTQLPMGTAHRLVGLLAHPLNRALVDDVTGRVVAGYTIVQPRVETTPVSARRTWFARIFAGDVGFDIYTHAVSELYQDLFGSGIYVGKGIYDVDAFMRSVDQRAPENALVSHDLFEGVHGRAALASDIVLFEDYPSSYVAYAKRMHRWVRGDWQLVRWLLPFVPSTGGRIRNRLSGIDRWKIVDNLRRSLTNPLLVVLLVLGWTWLPLGPVFWTAFSLVILLSPMLSGLGHRRSRLPTLARSGMALAFLLFEALIVVDAIVRVLVRTVITRKHLLEWTSAAHTVSGLEAKSLRRVCWATMWMSPVAAIGIAVLLAVVQPSALPIAGPLLAIWTFAPEIARWVSRPIRARTEALRPADRVKLRMLARKTWAFFDTFVGPNDQWLPIDNYQAEPHEQTAHRTSPTNIGLMLLATLSAYDFGYLGPSELTLRVRRAFDSIARLAHYQGHLLNWYETKNLQPLLPRYVSTVDSGNLAGCLIALAHGCREISAAPIVRTAAWTGLSDSLALLEEVLASGPTPKSLHAALASMQAAARHGAEHPREAYATLRVLCEETCPTLDRELHDFLASGAHRHEVDLLGALRTMIESVHQQLQSMRREIDSLLPWLALADEPAARALELPVDARLDELPALARRLQAELARWTAERRDRNELTTELVASEERVGIALRSAEAAATALGTELHALAAFAEREVRGMDFRLLFDRERKLFHIGYNATLDRIDPHYYDLLASEARLASYLAIVKRDVPESHWYALGRPMTRVAGAPALLSWGGTMFEFLMPSLLMRSEQGSLLARTCELAVDAQIAAARRGEPWGVSESAFARVDANHTYQYRAFGVPGLGFKRGLEEDRVVAPYASLLAVAIRPRAVIDNLSRLEAMGMAGSYGLFEALDFSPDRTPDGSELAVVRSYMAHHQGMLLVALGNVLTERSMVDRFHHDPMIEAGELLLNEHAPQDAPAEWPIVDDADPVVTEAAAKLPVPGPWSAIDDGHRQAFVLGNGRLSSLVTDTGGGGLRWQGLALTRYQPDSTCDDDGLWLYLRDEETHRVWRATSLEGRTTYAMHEVEMHRRNEGISVHVRIAVAPDDDVEVRHVTLHNESDRPRTITITSASRPVLFPTRQAPSHPAFSSLFVESERIAELDALVFARRPQGTKEEPAVLVHRLVHEDPAVVSAGYETDRGAFYGRGGSLSMPAALSLGRGALVGKTGAVLDPVMSLMARVTLKPKRSVTLAFVTTVGRSRSAAIELARQFGTMHSVRWTLHDAEQESPRRLQRAKLHPALLPAVQRLFSALLFADPTLRPAELAAIAKPVKTKLWGRGVSGDDPILLVRVGDPESPLLAETLAAQRYLRSCGVRLELVLIDELATGYASEGSGSLRRALVRADVTHWIGQRGGIFVIAADQIHPEERQRLEASARVVLDTRDASLAKRAIKVVDAPPQLPRFEPTLVENVAARRRQRPELRFDNELGGFTSDGREYVTLVATDQSTPAPWCNVIANPELGCVVSESSLGVTWSLNSGENRLTPWRNDPVLDPPSEVVYLRDEETAAVWSTTPQPAGRDTETLVRHGAGYTVYERESHGLEQTMTVFVPPGAAIKIVKLRLKNTLARSRRVTATYYAEWVLGTRREEQRPYIVSEHDRGHACLLATCTWNEEFGDRVAFLGAMHDVHGFTTDRTEFLGRRGDYARPAALERWGLSGSLAPGVDPCAALQVHLELAPGAEIETHFLLGQAASRDAALALLTRFRDRGAVDAAFTALHAYWDDILGTVSVITPEPAMNLLLDRWLLYQSLSARVFGRTGFYQSSGAFGFRDQLQDVLALVHAAPEQTRAHILDAAARQFEEGDVLHWWHPPSGRGVRTRCSDDLIWLPYVTAEYVAATGDVAILDEVVPFLTAAPLAVGEHDRYAQFATAPGASLLEHCRRALERGVTAGAHGIPLMGDGDWNDGMNRIGAKGRGESVWLGWFAIATMNRFADLSPALGEWRTRADALRVKIEASAWDGAWYLRAFHDDGSVVGAAANRECRIDSIAQSWAVLSRRPDEPIDERARAGVQAADDQLVREAERLVLLFWPPYDSTVHDPGYVRGYPPGIRENGGQYTHAATWLGWAHARLGDGDRATRIFELLDPILRTQTRGGADLYRVEPYALAADVYSCAPWTGRGGWTWYTGAAAWLWRLGIEGILGLRRERGALHVDPCIPKAWPGFEAWVRLGRARVHVIVDNAQHAGRGVISMTLDGVALADQRVEVDQSVSLTHEVRVELGASAREAIEPVRKAR